MRVLDILIILMFGLFSTQGWAPPPGKGGSPSTINMPKDQPGYSDLESARNRGGQGMSREMALKIKEKYSKVPINEISSGDIKTIEEAKRILNEKMGLSCCNAVQRCQGGTGNCWEVNDRNGRRTCAGFTTRC